MELLPEEIVNEILLLVDRPSLYHVSQVCVQWRQMALKQAVPINSKAGSGSLVAKVIG